MHPAQHRPLIVIGCPRSGTGLLHQVLRLHPALAWVTPVTNWVCGKAWFRRVPPPLARTFEEVVMRLPPRLVPPFLRGPHDGSLEISGLPETREGHSIWNRYCPDRDHHACTADAATPAVREGLRDVLRWHLSYHDRPRFLSKTPRSGLRIPFFHAVFPDAQFLHIVRDGRAVAASILKRRRADHGSIHEWWGARPPGWQDVRSRPPIRQAAWMWTTFLETIEREGRKLPDGSMHRVRYEDFTRAPEATLREIFDWAGLAPGAFFHSDAPRHLRKIHRPPTTWQDRLTGDQRAHLDVLEPMLHHYGYTVSNEPLQD